IGVANPPTEENQSLISPSILLNLSTSSWTVSLFISSSKYTYVILKHFYNLNLTFRNNCFYIWYFHSKIFIPFCSSNCLILYSIVSFSFSSADFLVNLHIALPWSEEPTSSTSIC